MESLKSGVLMPGTTVTHDLNQTALLRLSTQRALVGNVSANLAGLCAHVTGTQLIVSAYFFNDPSAVDRELTEEIAAEVAGDFPDNYSLETQNELITTIAPNNIEWMFLRAEVFV